MESDFFWTEAHEQPCVLDPLFIVTGFIRIVNHFIFLAHSESNSGGMQRFRIDQHRHTLAVSEELVESNNKTVGYRNPMEEAPYFLTYTPP